MTQTFECKIHVLNVFLVCFISVFSCLGCSKNAAISIAINSTRVQSDSNASACIDVNGFVLGNIILNSSVYLYQSPDLEYDTVMMTVRTNEPIMIGKVNDLKKFNFTCLSYGKYVVSIPSKSYAHNSVGAPLPYEFENTVAALKIVFQGGNSQYLVGAFTIDMVHH